MWDTIDEYLTFNRFMILLKNFKGIKDVYKPYDIE